MIAHVFKESNGKRVDTLLVVAPLRRKGGRVARVFRVPYTKSGAKILRETPIEDFYVRDRYSYEQTVKYFETHRRCGRMGTVAGTRTTLPKKAAEMLTEMLEVGERLFKVTRPEPMKGWFNNAK